MSPAKVICPFCSAPVPIKRFGAGWVGICCREIIYNSDLPPADAPAHPGVNVIPNQQFLRATIKKSNRHYKQAG